MSTSGSGGSDVVRVSDTHLLLVFVLVRRVHACRLFCLLDRVEVRIGRTGHADAAERSSEREREHEHERTSGAGS